MKRTNYRPYLFLIVFFFCVMSLSENTTEKLRSTAICSLAPCWEGLNVFKEKACFLLAVTPRESKPAVFEGIDLEQVLQENQLLRAQMESMREWLLFQDRIEEQLERLKAVNAQAAQEGKWKEFFVRRSEELVRALELKIASIPARVVFRDPTSWSSTVWINLGEKDNERLERRVIGPFSPVLCGTSVVGVVEHVGKHQSRVRLITDSRLSPSVRVVRGQEQNRHLLEHLEAVILSLQLRSDLFADPAQIEPLIHYLSQIRSALLKQTGDVYLAKGVLHGTSHPLWRSRSPVLKGIGFNYDFSDKEGPSRDLRLGTAYDTKYPKEPVSLLKTGDLLVTTGLDGIFPAGLQIAVVSSVATLKEGSTSYDIEAVSTAGDLNELSNVFVLPPLDSSR